MIPDQKSIEKEPILRAEPIVFDGDVSNLPVWMEWEPDPAMLAERKRQRQESLEAERKKAQVTIECQELPGSPTLAMSQKIATITRRVRVRRADFEELKSGAMPKEGLPGESHPSYREFTVVSVEEEVSPFLLAVITYQNRLAPPKEEV